MKNIRIEPIVLCFLLAAGSAACSGTSSPASGPGPEGPTATEVEPASTQVDDPAVERSPSVTPSTGENVVAESPYSCDEVGGKCMEGCDPGYMLHDTPHKPCFDAVCCVAETMPTCADVGGICVEGCEAGTKPAVDPTRGCVDSGCCVPNQQ